MDFTQKGRLIGWLRVSIVDERLNRVIDYFDAWDLVQLLGLSSADIVAAFSDDVEDKIEALEDIMEI